MIKLRNILVIMVFLTFPLMTFGQETKLSQVTLSLTGLT